MGQLHKRFSYEQVASLLQAYTLGLMGREEVQKALDISRARFFVLRKEYREALTAPILFSSPLP